METSVLPGTVEGPRLIEATAVVQGGESEHGPGAGQAPRTRDWPCRRGMPRQVSHPIPPATGAPVMDCIACAIISCSGTLSRLPRTTPTQPVYG